MSHKSTPFAVVGKNTLATQKSLDINDYFISSALQTTLEFHELIAIFCSKLQTLIPHSGYSYDNDAFNIHLNSGIVTPHSYAYALKLENHELGELKFMRNQRFTAAEIKKLEALLVILCYPLKNATLYKQAILMASIDPLTKVNNRSAFNDTLNREIQLANRSQRALSLIFLDIDNFKNINDNHGHTCGDFVLSSVAAWITQAIRGTDMVFRYGGEEFVVILSDTPRDGAEAIAERIRNEIAKHSLAYGVALLDVTASLGVTTLRSNDNQESLLQRADQAMYLAKRNGRNQVQAA